MIDKYVTKSESQKDKRVIILKLSKEGKLKFNSVKNRASKKFELSLKELTEDELNEVSRSLDCLEDLFKKIQGEKI